MFFSSTFTSVQIPSILRAFMIVPDSVVVTWCCMILSFRSLSSHSPVVSMSAGMTLVPAAVPVMTQGSDTICPECGLKDDGSPMIGKHRLRELFFEVQDIFIW